MIANNMLALLTVRYMINTKSKTRTCINGVSTLLDFGLMVYTLISLGP